MKKARWTINDLINLEYFLQRDEREEESGHASLAERDRNIYLNHIQPLKEKGGTLTPRLVVRLWLERRMLMEKSDAVPKTGSPGEIFGETYRLMKYGFLIVGLLAGSGVAFSFLNYRGTEPLNVSLYLGGFVFIQILLILLLLGIFIIRSTKRSPLRSSVIYTLLSGLLTKLFVKFNARAFASLSGSKRGGLEALIGLIKGKKQTYGSLFFWPLFILTQTFGVGFNLGVLAATLLKVVGSDIAFGWQSTVQVSARVVFNLVQLISLPWSWFVRPEIAYPSLSDIEGSHMVLKDGIYHLATENLVSWWPFLCFAVFCYGLMPRLLLLAGGLAAQNRVLAGIDFGHSACERLLSRMRTPLVNFAGSPERGELLRTNDVQVTEAPLSDPEAPVMGKDVIALIPDEIFEACPDKELESIVFRTLGYHIRQTLRFGKDVEGDQAVLGQLSRMKEEAAAPLVFILQEAWQPPIKEHLFFIRHLRETLGKSANITVGLIGRPGPDTIFTRVKDEDWKAWHQKLKGLGDSYLSLERLAVHDAGKSP